MNMLEPNQGPTYAESAEGVMRTRSGSRVALLNPTPDMINIADIAAGLSKICRFTGQSNVVYTVAEHSVAVARDAEMRFGLQPLGVLAALLHDAAEAYLNDISRPIKEAMRALAKEGGFVSPYDVLESRMEKVIDQVFGIDRHDDLRRCIKESDNIVYVREVEQFMGDGSDWATADTSVEAEINFLRMYDSIIGSIHGA